MHVYYIINFYFRKYYESKEIILYEPFNSSEQNISAITHILF